MLAKLKVECGHQFTQKLEGMFTDMKVSADTMVAYRTYLGGKEVSAAHHALPKIRKFTLTPIPRRPMWTSM